MPQPPRPRTKRPQLSAFIARTQHSRARKPSTLTLGTPDPQRHFTPERHALTPEQCRLANALLRKAEQERPLVGDSRQKRFRHALRCAGIVSAIKRNLVGNTKFGHHLQGYRGGRVMQRHGLHILREIAPIGHLAARVARERREAETYYETHGVPLPLGTEPAATREEQRIQDLQQRWEAEQWETTQLERLRW